MNLKTTIVLLVCAVAGGVLYCYAPSLAPQVGLAPQTKPSASETLRILEEELTADKITAIEVRQGDRVLVLERGPGDAWVLPGKWPTRSNEVKQLVALLANLRSRFEPVTVSDETSLKDYGLDQPAVAVTLRTADKSYRLALGEPEAAPKRDEPNEPGDQSRFARPTYLRLGEKNGDAVTDQPEIIRLAPGLIAALDRPVDYYQQRRLFPADRVAKEGDTQDKEDRLSAKSLSVKEKRPGGSDYTLNRAGDDWELTAPVRDHADPDKLKSLLTAVPDIWAEQFVDKPKKDLAEYGLQDPEQTVRVTRPGGETMVLLIGKMSQMKTRSVMKPSPPGMPLPPQRDIVHDEYRYAKLQDNDQIFEVRAEKLKDVFVPLDAVRDARVARFRSADATRLELAPTGQKPIIFVKDKDKGRWKLEEPFQSDAESTKVMELLDKLSGLQARDADVLDNADPKTYSLDKPTATIKVTVEEEEGRAGGVNPPGDKKKVTRTFTVALGKDDKTAKKLYVQAAGWPRISAVEDSLLPLVERPALAYRGRRVLDFSTADLDTIKVQRDGETLALKQADGKWQLTEPVSAEADTGKASQLASQLSGLEVTEYVTESAKMDDLEPQYGLGKPALSVTFTVHDAQKPAQTLLLGKQRPNHSEYFAKLAGSDSVFAVKKDFRDALDQGSLAYRPVQFPSLPPEQATELRVQKEGQEEYRLAHKDGVWKVAAPFEAGAVASLVQPMVDDVAHLKAERYEAHAAKELDKYGLDKPYLRLALTLSPQKDAAGKETPRERVLHVGKPTEKDAPTRFAKLADSDAIFVVGAPLVAAEDHAALDLLDRNLLTLDREQIERVHSEHGDAKVTLQKEKGDWKVTDSPASPFTADREAVATILSAWTNLRANRFAAYGPRADLAAYGLDKPAGTVAVTLPKPAVEGKKPETAEHTIELGKAVDGEAGSRYARLDKGPGVVVLPAATVAELTHTYLDFVDRTVLDLDPANVSALLRQMGKDNLEVVKRDEGWQIVKPTEQPGDDKTMQDLLRLLTQKARRVAAYPAQDVKPFGLDEPAAVVTLRLAAADGKTTEHVVKIGKPADEKEGKERFAQVQGSSIVLVLPAALSRELLAGPLGFRNRTLARFIDADRAILERGPRKAVFAKVDGTWKLVEPLEAEAEHTELENLINVVAKLQASELVAEKPSEADLKRYGLDKPEGHWRFLSGDKEELSLLLGRREQGGGRCYTKLEKGDLVAVLDTALAGKLFAEYRSRSPWSPSLDSAQVEVLTYTRGGTSFRLEKVNNHWQVEGKPESKIKDETVNDTLAAIAGLKAERFVMDKGAELKLYGLEPAELTVEVETPSGKRVLHVGRAEGESKRYYACVPEKNRTDVFVIGEADAARIVRDLAAFTQAPAKADKPTP
jgi:hypothetical protein